MILKILITDSVNDSMCSCGRCNNRTGDRNERREIRIPDCSNNLGCHYLHGLVPIRKTRGQAPFFMLTLTR